MKAAWGCKISNYEESTKTIPLVIHRLLKGVKKEKMS
jgi:hypothetical protein